MSVIERFLRYVQVDTCSDDTVPDCPSTPGQRVLADMLADEMKNIGIADARVDEHGYVYGSIPANTEGQPVIGLIAHMDTSPAVSGKDVKPRLIKAYDGGDIVLDEAGKYVLSPASFAHLQKHIGQDLIVTSGDTLLGADDKAGIAEILTMAEKLIADPSIPHGKIAIGFTPDEEIGRGADLFDVAAFGADYAYTIDGGELGVMQCENFNAASADVVIHGLSIHPGGAKGKMKNALLIGMEFHRMLPPFEDPANTSGYEGFHHLNGFSGVEEQAKMHYIIRDHDMARFEEKKARFVKVAEYLNERFGAGTVELTLTDSYYNMKEKLAPRPEIMERAGEAMKACGVSPFVVPIRGGTDGARLSYMGLPCPNLSAGGFNGHGRFEYIPVYALEKMAEVLAELVRAK